MAIAKASIPILPPPENSLKNIQALRTPVQPSPGLRAEVCLCGLNLWRDDLEKTGDGLSLLSGKQ